MKSAHYKLRERGRKEGDRRLHQSKWTTIWKTYVWSKVKSYMWKLASNALPVRANLKRRGILISPLCLACDEVDTVDDGDFQATSVDDGDIQAATTC